jgi:hypothetical protein
MGVPRMHRPMDPSEMPNLPPPGFSADGSLQSAAATSQLHVATGQVSCNRVAKNTFDLFDFVRMRNI